MRMQWFRLALAVLVALAVGLDGYVSLFKSGTGASLFGLGLLAWSCLPYVAALALSRAVRDPRVGFVAAASALLVDAWTYRTVFVAPTSSTASLALLWAPLWNILVVVPLAAGVTWLLLWRSAARCKLPSVSEGQKGGP